MTLGNIFKNKKNIRILITVITILLLIGGFTFYQFTRDRVFIDNSLINAPIIAISPNTPGKVLAMNVVDGQNVHKGDLLATVGSETLYADTNGIIVSAQDIVGGLTNSQTPLIQLINPTNIRVAGTLDENKGLDQIKVGQIVSFTVDAFPGKTYWGYVDEVSPTAKQTQLNFTISDERPTQQFVVYARFDTTKSPEIKNGMSAKMVVYTKN